MQTTVEFVIDDAKSALLGENKQKIEVKFNVTIVLNKIFNESNGKGAKRWICISGLEEDIINAKEYTLNFISPGEVIHLKNIIGHPLFTATKSNEIEKVSLAVLKENKDGSLTISGSDMAVTVAQSLIDEMFSQVIDPEADYLPDETADDINLPTDKNNSSFIAITTGTPTKIDCFKSSGQHGCEDLARCVYASGSSLHPSGYGTSSKTYAANPQILNDKGDWTHTDQQVTGELWMDTSDSQPSCKQREYLINLATTIHYSPQDIEMALAKYNMDDVIRPADFLKTVRDIKASRHGGGYTLTQPAVSSDPALPGQGNQPIPIDADVSTIIISDDEPEEIEAPKVFAKNVGNPIQLSAGDQGSSSSKTLVPRVGPVDAPMEIGTWNAGLLPQDRSENAGAQHDDLRYIVIDGSNVAMAHGDNKRYSVPGLEICINYFRKRGHTRITAFVPESRRYTQNQTEIIGKQLLEKLNREGYVKFTPSRRFNGQVINSYDDRYILNLAEKEDGIVVSNDQFRDLCQERESYYNIIANRLLPFMFVGDHFMPPDDPLGKHGPNLDQFLRISHETVPYFTMQYPTHPPNRDKKFDRYKRNARHNVGNKMRWQSQDHPVRSHLDTEILYRKLVELFPEPFQRPQIETILANHKDETDLNRLTNYVINSF
ncbi:NEDD4-binding protein 1-like [Physella acuta]|uniref:NEDD4-binding protein 1-like n=1 Tax=Physella acuta TaxID=109671 RepID=UPI0027DC963C|nr:NEDD4-binding protein 1-like [Physella acuta]XP_059163513.1 NEDD4-binding protein 1-like [Physella acuta]XP_059163514.1 NEDD4-binding protein 1-like [Physella acuta]XP_059163515.1 NEDD4-binding protein 1-like [Physella acuta]